ncbi:MAG: serine/threonine dehydratase [Acidimicrobiales bacterium]
MTQSDPVSRQDISVAAQHIEAYVRRTPTLALRTGLVLKLEFLQHTGSFKARGAFNFVLTRPALPPAGIIAASGGNHGMAVAHVGRVLGLRTEVFVPKVSSPLKRERIAALGATVTVVGDIYDDALAASLRRAAETGALAVPAFDAVATIAGAGTLFRELSLDEPDLDTVVVAVGGGGLVAGALAWYRRDLRVVAVEPETSAALHAALQAGEPVKVPVSGIAADSLGAATVGQLPFELAARHLHRSLVVSDEDIAAAQEALWGEARILAEPGGAAAYAAILSGTYQPGPGERVGVIVCGANVARPPTT